MDLEQAISELEGAKEDLNDDELYALEIVSAAARRAAELEKQNLAWLEWSESKGPGLDAYREQSAKIAELKAQLERVNGLNEACHEQIDRLYERANKAEAEVERTNRSLVSPACTSISIRSLLADNATLHNNVKNLRAQLAAYTEGRDCHNEPPDTPGSYYINDATGFWGVCVYTVAEKWMTSLPIGARWYPLPGPIPEAPADEETS